MSTRGEIAAASGAIRKAINKISDVLAVPATHETTPTRDFDAILKRVRRKEANDIKAAVAAQQAKSDAVITEMTREILLLQQQLEDSIAHLRDRDDELEAAEQRVGGAADAAVEIEELREAEEYERERADDLSLKVHVASRKAAEDRRRIESLEEQLSTAHRMIAALSVPKAVSRRNNQRFIPKVIRDLFVSDRSQLH